MATLLQWCGIPRARWFMGERANRAPSFEGLLTRTTPRKESPSFTPPYDKNFPLNGPRTPSKAVRNLHLEVAHQIVTSMARGKLTPAEIVKLSEEVSREATDVQTLTRKLNELEKRLS